MNTGDMLIIAAVAGGLFLALKAAHGAGSGATPAGTARPLVASSSVVYTTPAPVQSSPSLDQYTASLLGLDPSQWVTTGGTVS